jgi:AsmA protein
MSDVASSAARSTGWRRFLVRPKWLLAALVAGPLGYAAVAPWTFSEPAFREEIARQVLRSTGLKLDTGARFAFALLPRPLIKIEEPNISDASSGFALRAAYLKGSLRLLPLLGGRLEMARVSLMRPHFAIDLDALPLGGGDAQARQQLAQRQFGVVSINDGSAQIASRAQGVAHRIDGINVQFDWRSTDAPLSITGAARLNGYPTEIALWTARPGDALRGDASPITLRLKNAALSLSAAGSAVLGARPQYSGRLAVTAQDLPRALDFIGTPEPPRLAPFRLFALSGEGMISRNAGSLSNLTLSTDGNDFEGALAWRREAERFLLTSTLATNFLNLAPFANEAPALTGPDGFWSRDPLSGSDLSRFDLDLRVSAARARLGRLQADEAALSVMLKNGRLELGLSEAKTYKGVVKGRFLTQSAGAGVESRMTVGFIGVDMSSLLWDALGHSKISGLATGSLIFSGAGESVAQIARNLDGRGQIQINQGDVSGVDLEQILRRMEKRPLVGSAELRSGRTSFEQLSANLRVEQGAAQIDEGLLNGKGVRVAFSGLAAIPERTIRFEAIATPATTSKGGDARKDAPQFPFRLQGPWDDPSLSFDAQGMIRRSGAAQPLLPKPPEPPAASPEEPALAPPQ